MSGMEKECPKCGRIFERYSQNGNIGYCELHGWFPVKPGAEAEATEANRREKELREKQKKEGEERKKRAHAAAVRAKQRNNAIAVVAVALCICAAVAAVYRFKIYPASVYKKAGGLFEERKYSEAEALYKSLNGYNDSPEKAVLCEALAEIESGNYQEALTLIDGSSSMSQEEAFRLIFDTQIGACRKASKGDGLQMWSEFGTAYKKELDKYGLMMEFSAEEVSFKKAYADELAETIDPACISLYEELLDSDADIKESLLSAVDLFPVGWDKVQLRKLLVRVSKDDETMLKEQKELLNLDTGSCIENWRELKIDPASVLSLLAEAEAQGVTTIDRAAIARDAGLAAAEQKDNVLTYFFADYNGDEFEELTVFTEQGKLIMYDLESALSVLTSLDTRFEQGSLTRHDDVFVALSSDESAFHVITCDDVQFRSAFETSGVRDIKIDGNVISYLTDLPGSIERSWLCEYSLDTLPETASIKEVNWQQNNYPYPESPEELVQRYYEASGYDIQDEVHLLESQYSLADFGIDVEEPTLFPSEIPFTVSSSVIYYGDDIAMMETRIGSGTIYTLASFEDDWHYVGAFSDNMTGVPAEEQDQTCPILALNAYTYGSFEKKGESIVFRIFVMSAGQLQFVWQAGEKQSSKNVYQFSLYNSKELTDESCIDQKKFKQMSQKQVIPPYLLTPGIYYLKLETLADSGEEFTIEADFTQNSNIEMEANDTPETANPVSLNEEYTANLGEPSDIDCFSYELEEDGAVDVTVSTSNVSSEEILYQIEIYNSSSGKLLTQLSLAGTQRQVSTDDLYLHGGTYYIRVKQGDKYTSLDYKVSVNFSKAENVEAESNDTVETANSILTNTVVKGVIGVEGDVDCFKFVADSNVVIQPNLTFAPLETNFKTYTLDIMDGNSILLHVDIGGKEAGKMIAPLPLAAGSYTVKVTNPNYVRQSYELTINSENAETVEQEPNDTLAAATMLQVDGDVITGSLTTETDIDIYKVSLTETREVTLCIRFAQQPGDDPLFEVEIEREGKITPLGKVKGSSGLMEKRIQMPAGDCYIRIKSEQWAAVTYSIQITS